MVDGKGACGAATVGRHRSGHRLGAHGARVGRGRAGVSRRRCEPTVATLAATEHKVRIKDLTRQVMPCTPLTGDLGQADLAVLEHYADPRELLAAGREQLTTLIATASHNHQGAARAEQWIAAAHTALDLYGTHPAMPFTDLAAEITTEVRLLRAISTELAAHAAQRETSYRQSDPAQPARSPPGL